MRIKFLFGILFALILVNIVLADEVVYITPKPAYDNDALTCVSTIDDTGMTYSWYNNYSSSSSAYGKTLPASYTSVGDIWTCKLQKYVAGVGWILIGQDSIAISGIPNQPPILQYIGDKVVNELENLNFTVFAYDPNNDPLSFSANNLPPGSDFNILTHIFKWTPGDNQAGTYYVTFTVTDIYGASESETIKITVLDKAGTINEAPVASITNPADSSVFEENENIIFRGNGTDKEDGMLSGNSLSWASSRDGFLGNGNQISISNLSRGRHYITLTVTDSDGAVDTDTITIDVVVAVNDAPFVNIISPPDSFTTTLGNTINFLGSATDDEDGTLYGSSLVWSSSIDGFLGTGTSIHISTLSVGTHSITLTATDSEGASASDSITVIILPLPVNQLPVVEIVSPANSSLFNLSETIVFEGTAYDPEDGTLTGNSLKWSSSMDGIFGYGEIVSISNLSEGMHTITLTATDSAGLSASDSIVIFIGNVSNITLPTVEIISPENATYNYSNILVNISSTNADNVTYSIDGGAEISYIDAFFNLFTDGWHTIVAIARNIFGIATDSVTFFVNISGANDTTAPLVALISPLNNTNATNPITFVFNVSDDSDVDGCDLIVYNSTLATIDGINGQNSITRNLSLGRHSWQVRCADAFGNIGYSEIRTLNVLAQLIEPPEEEEPEEEGFGLYIGRIIYDEITGAGSEIEFSVSMKNNGPDLEDLKLIISIQELGIRAVVGPFDLEEDKGVTKRATLEIPDGAEPGKYDVRITVQNEEVNRVKYREIEIHN